MMYLAATVFPAPLSPLGTDEARNDRWPGVGEVPNHSSILLVPTLHQALFQALVIQQ